MKQETKEISGEVQNIRKDRKAIEIEEVWYQSNFNPISEDINKGDNVKINYSVKGDFKNVVKIEKVESKNLDNEITVTEHKPIKDSTTINNLVMCSKDIFIALKDNKLISLKSITKQVIENYKQIKESL